MKNRPLLYMCLMILAAIVLVVTGGGDRFIRELRPSTLEQMVSQDDAVNVRGQVYNLEQKENYQAVYLKKNSIQRISQIQHKEQSFHESKIIAYIDPNIQIHIGNKIEIKGEVSFFENARNPGNFDQKLYYQIQDIHGIIWGSEVRLLDSDRWKLKNALVEFRGKWKENLVDAMGEEEGTVMGAMILGEKSGMDQELKALYQANGIGHILAISGLHLSFVGIGLYRILRRLTGSYPVGGVFGISFLMLYILMIGFTVSAVRALVMFLFRVGADMTGRHYDAPTAFSVAAVVVLLWRPLSLYDGGFWLSFGAVFAILTVVPIMQKGIVVRALCNGSKVDVQSPRKQNEDSTTLSVCFEGFWKHMWQGILQGLTASIGINLVILPILLYYFFEFPLYSFILNLFVIPLMSVLLFLGMAGSLFALWCGPVSSFLLLVCGGILRIYQISCKITLHLSGARLVIGKPDVWKIVVYYGLLFSGLVLLRHLLSEKERKEKGSKENRENLANRTNQGNQGSTQSSSGNPGARISKRADKSGRKRWFVIFLWAVGIVILTTCFGEEGKLTTVVLDVGQGDGIFMKGPKGGTYLVDGGSSDVKKVGQYRLESFLKSQGVGVLDYVLISHGDSDHMNGVEELIERQDIGVGLGTLVLPVEEVWDEALAGVAEKAKDYGVRVVVMGSGQSIREENMEITCIQPGDRGIETGMQLDAGNAASMVLAVRYGGFDMLLTGDVEGEGEELLTEQLEEQYRDCTWEVLKVAHHGSKNSSNVEFLRQVQPVYALVSAGRENRYGHPHQETIERLTDVGSTIYSTQENGAIIVEVEDGQTKIRQK